ncbi:MAG: Stk1 family PASTA domain-containing Ser/Thr kinase, partial [Eggerthellaceae bacterium]|nr:Stk1 family PASTA domain-containing Ser/Thr kinase [Eggerthellaceae bacterium]
MVGKVFTNRYQVTERIGIGGMAEVYRAQDLVLGRMVAVKVMLPQYAADEEFTKRFRQEAASAANLSSPYIVNVYDWGQDDGTYYIVMEYVRGSDLKTAIKQRGAINQRKVAEIGAQVCQALSVAHNQDIIHRDIKPQNIMVQPDGNVKVMDFGIARAKNSMHGETNAVLGTAHYISPEQAQGKELTAASDIYSLGVVLYEASTGKLPFEGPDSVSVATKQVQELPVPPSQVNPDINPALESIIMKALEKDPTNRFETVGDMKHALNDFLAGRAVNLDEGVGVAAGTAATEALVRNSGPLYDNTTVMQGVNYGQQQGVYSDQPRTYLAEEEDENRGGAGRTAAIVLAILAALALIGAAAYFLLGNGAASSSSSSSSSSTQSSSSQVSVPDVAGKTVEEATALLEQAGLKVASTHETTDDTYPAGQVVRTDPAVGAGIAPGTAVTLYVSSGKEQVSVPDLSGNDGNGAKQLIEAAGLKAHEGASEHSDSVEEGKVIRPEPEAGAMVDAGSTVTYILSPGSDKVEVPDVMGKSEAEAT